MLGVVVFGEVVLGKVVFGEVVVVEEDTGIDGVGVGRLIANIKMLIYCMVYK